MAREQSFEQLRREYDDAVEQEASTYQAMRAAVPQLNEAGAGYVDLSDEQRLLVQAHERAWLTRRELAQKLLTRRASAPAEPADEPAHGGEAR